MMDTIYFNSKRKSLIRDFLWLADVVMMLMKMIP